MSIDSRGRTRDQMPRRAVLVAWILVLLALLFLVTGHWVLGVIVGALPAAAVRVFLQVRTVR